MSSNMPPRDLRTLGYVLRRTNYGEYDRILNLITPEGKFAVLAKGARKEKSKLAGGIELFTLTDFNLHFGGREHAGERELGVLTGARMRQFHAGIIRDLARMELAAKILKQVSSAAEGSNTAEYFRITDQSLTALGNGKSLELVATWAELNLKKTAGEELNLYRDSTGAKLAAGQTYRWDAYENIFVPTTGAGYGTDEIKLLRLMTGSDLSTLARVQIPEEVLMRAYQLVCP